MRDLLAAQMTLCGCLTVAIPACVLLLPECFFSTPGAAQEIAPTTQSPEITFHSSSDLVLVDVIARNAKDGLPDKTLKKSDFQIFDNDQLVAIKTFDSGAQFTTRSLFGSWCSARCKVTRRKVPGCSPDKSVFSSLH
jgi:hypothetical protein